MLFSWQGRQRRNVSISPRTAWPRTPKGRRNGWIRSIPTPPATHIANERSSSLGAMATALRGHACPSKAMGMAPAQESTEPKTTEIFFGPCPGFVPC
jgi:hypothetical protein